MWSLCHSPGALLLDRLVRLGEQALGGVRRLRLRQRLPHRPRSVCSGTSAALGQFQREKNSRPPLRRLEDRAPRWPERYALHCRNGGGTDDALSQRAGSLTVRVVSEPRVLAFRRAIEPPRSV